MVVLVSGLHLGAVLVFRGVELQLGAGEGSGVQMTRHTEASFGRRAAPLLIFLVLLFQLLLLLLVVLLLVLLLDPRLQLPLPCCCLC